MNIFERNPYRPVLKNVKGPALESMLLQLASIGGTPLPLTPEQQKHYGQTERFSVNRVARTEVDIEAREVLIKPWLQELGMQVHEHPMGLIAHLAGSEPDLPAIAFGSHTDTVPKADMYDGTYGVVASIAAVKAIKEAGITPRRPLLLTVFTGEESAGFNFALFGSRAMFHGLTEAELDSRKPGGQSIRETLTDQEVEIVKNPVLGPRGSLFNNIGAFLELHVEQNDELERAKKEVGVVERIASPVRHIIKVGDSPLEVDSATLPNQRMFKLTARGKADHSGATPMGYQRADGLVVTADLFEEFLRDEENLKDIRLDIGKVTIDNQALNKIPGTVTTEIRIGGEHPEHVESAIENLKDYMGFIGEVANVGSYYFPEEPFTLEEMPSEHPSQFYKDPEMNERYRQALRIISEVSETCLEYNQHGVVGTVGTLDLHEGILSLGLDLRGIDKDTRSDAKDAIKWRLQDKGISFDFGPALSGSSDPTTMDPDVVSIIEDSARKYKYMRMYSKAGHDAQNAAAAETPAGMIFVPSQDGGIAHNPSARTDKKYLEKGARVLAESILKLANA